MSTILTAVALLGFVGLIFAILMFVHKRDKKRDAEKEASTL